MQEKVQIYLSDVSKRKPVKLVSIKGGKGITQRLGELGLTPGTELKVIQDSGGPLIINVRNSKIAIGRGMAKKMMVELIEAE